MNCPFLAAFLTRLEADLARASISLDLIEKVQKLKEVEVSLEATPTRTAWACRAAIAGLVFDEKSAAPPPARSWVLHDAFLSASLAALEPLKRYFTVNVTERRILDPRDAEQVQQRADESQLKQVQRVEAMLRAAQRGDSAAGGDAFYDFVYRLCRDVEALPAWAQRLTEIR